MQMENELSVWKTEKIQSLIYTIRGKQVVLDSDVAMLYGYNTKRINETVKRNAKRFPESFCFQLDESDLYILRSQIATLNKKINNGNVERKYSPYVFTEQGVAMLSGLLKNDIAIQVSINIMTAFVNMRKFILVNGQVFERLTSVEQKLLEHDKKFDEVFNQFQLKEGAKQQIFFQGQIWDSYSLIVDIIKKASKKITIIDNYIDESVLKMLAKKKAGVQVIILTSQHTNIKNLDIQKFNKQYPVLQLIKTNKFHDRFIMLDDYELYHCGASIKDLGNKCFAISRIENNEIVKLLKNVI